MKQQPNRREFMRNVGLSAAAAPFMLNLPSLGFANNQGGRKQRLIIMFSPNGVVPWNYWPDEVGSDFKLKEIMKPLEPFKDQTLILKGLSDKMQGDGDRHMRGIGCLLTGVELFPGNIQGGSDTPAGWASGHSIDQEIKRFLQSKKETRTRFGSLEFGVLVPERADTWTRMVYAGPNQPIAPIDDPYVMFKKLYGQMKDQKALQSVLDDVQQDLKKLRTHVSKEDQQLLEDHTNFVREMEQQLRSSNVNDGQHAVPKLEQGIKEENDNMPRIAKMQMDLLINSFMNDFTRVATLQFSNSVGQSRMKWLGINDGHHSLSHKPDKDKDAMEKLTKIDTWFCEQMAYLAKRLKETPEPGGPNGGGGTMLDNTTIIWTNELGQGNSHTLNNVPMVMVGGGLDFKMGRSLRYKNEPHNRLLVSLAHAYGHRIERFGNVDLSKLGPLPQLT